MSFAVIHADPDWPAGVDPVHSRHANFEQAQTAMHAAVDAELSALRAAGPDRFGVLVAYAVVDDAHLNGPALDLYATHTGPA